MIEHVTQMVERLDGIVFQGKPVKCYSGNPPAGVRAPFLFVWTRPPVPSSVTACGVEGELDERLHVQVVAESQNNVLALAGLVGERLHGWKPDVPGWRFFPVKIVDSTPVQSEQPASSDLRTNTPPRWATLTVRARATRKE